MPVSSDPGELWAAAVATDLRAMARIMSIVEEGRAGHHDLLAAAHQAGGHAYTVGVTGAPGSGKSTLTNALITRFRRNHERVGVVAVDPSSPFTGGAILGDRIRMQEHVSDRGVFVRSMSSRGHLGGLADGTAKVVAVFDAMAYDPIVVETVGVGQSEVEVMDLADTVVVVVTPGMGDGIQAAKAGLLEVGDVFVMNKADLPGAADVVRDLTQMIELSGNRDWDPPIVSTVATVADGVDELVEAVAAHRAHLSTADRLERRRRARAETTIKRAVLARLSEHLDAGGVADEVVDRVVARRLDPWAAAAGLAR